MEEQLYQATLPEFTAIKLSRKWINKDFVDLTDISDDVFMDTMMMLGHTIKSYETLHDDTVIEFHIGSKRPDCGSVIGLAREAAAAFNRPIVHREPAVQGCEDSSIYEWLDVDVPADALCNRYTCRLVKNVKIDTSPEWLRQRLIASGITPVNNIIDIANYVMVEYGQQIHILDYRCVSNGELIVREALEGETLKTLEGTHYQLESGMPVIMSAESVVGLAGLSISEEATITEDTEAVIFAAANFRSDCIRQTMTTLRLDSHAIRLMENRPDPLLTVPAIQRTCELVELLGCGEVLDGMIDVLNYIPNPQTLELEPEKISQLLGSEISWLDMMSYLKRLEISVEGSTVLLPSFRMDLSSSDDIAAEVMRLHNAAKSLLMLQKP